MKMYDESVLKNDLVINNYRSYQQCVISLMDTIADPDITFNSEGICNYYYEFLKKQEEQVFIGQSGEEKLLEIVDKIKTDGYGKMYDCIAGISGGVDSTYVALMAKKLGLRTLIVHFDNGWNSELAIKNIENIISVLGFELYTLVVDWDEFRDLQLAYLKASVVDIEVLSDHAIIGTLYRLAVKYDIKHILSGANVVTEAVLPSHWVWNKTDHINIKDIHDKYGKLPLKTYPLYTTKQKRFDIIRKKIGVINLLNYIPYNKKCVKETIIAELNWRDYGGKHYESIFTRFYQGYILPVKFGIDKRKAHLSNLIFSGQITKDEAFVEIGKPIYDLDLLKEDYVFVLKKLGLSEQEFEEYINAPRREHDEFKTEETLYKRFPAIKFLKPAGDFVKKVMGSK